jgi:hypothetical protein
VVKLLGGSPAGDKNPDKNLNFKKENIWISYDSNHLDLISNPKILNKIKVWLV